MCVVMVAIGLLSYYGVFHSSDSGAVNTAAQSTTRVSSLAGPESYAEAWNDVRGEESKQSDILAKAQARRDDFIQLMKTNPSEAMEKAITLEQYLKLPEELRPFFEKPLNTIGDIDLIWETSDFATEHKCCNHQNTLSVGSETLSVYSADRHVLPVMQAVPVDGIRLGSHAVVHGSGVRTLSLEEIKLARKLFPLAEGSETDPVTQLPSDKSNAALIAGKIHCFQTPEIVSYVARELTEAIENSDEKRLAKIDHEFSWIAGDTGGDEGTGDAQNTPYMVDQIDVLFIRVDFSDFPGAPISKSDLETTLATVDGHISANSYGTAGLTYTVSNTVYRMPNTGASYAVAGDNQGIQDDARALAGGDYTLSNYDVIAVYFPRISSSQVSGSQINYGGRASIGGANHWINGTNNVGVILHEFGHNYGLYHANYFHPEQVLGGTYQLPDSLEYGDIFDVMGDGNPPEGEFSHLAKNYLDWLPDSKVVECTGDATYTIYRFDDQNALSNPLLAVKVPMSGNVNYWIGFRQQYTSSSYNLSDAAYVVAENLANDRETSLIDMTPESQSSESADRRDAGLPVGGTYYDSSAGVRFNALEKGGTAPNQWIKVQVIFDPRISVADTSMSVEEECGVAHVLVQRRFSSSGVVSVNYSTSNGSASEGSDYYATSGTLTWEDGDMADKTIIVPIRPDITAEGTEDFIVTLSGITGGKLDAGASTTTITLLDAGQRLTTFSPPFFRITVNAIAPLDNGKVMVGGDLYDVSGFPSISDIMRLNADGSVDTTFVSGTGFNGEVEDIKVQSDGKYLIGGAFTSYNGTSCNRLIRLNTDGSIDNTFLTNIGSAANNRVRVVEIESDGDILVGGSFSSFNGVAANGIVRLGANGLPATALATPLSSSATVYDILAEPDGKFLVVGNFNLGWTGAGFHSGIARLNNNGSRDTSFNADAGAHTDGNRNSIRPLYSIARQPDGKYVIGGWFTAYDETTANHCARINNNGSIDATFSAPSFNNSVQDVIVQANGKVAAGGWFTSPASRLERLTNTGASDSTFIQGTGVGGSVYDLASGPDGSLWVGGNFFSYNGSSSRPVIRLAGGEDPYEVWKNNQFSAAQISAGDAAYDQDPDGDGIVNLAEMAMGTNPNVANSDPVFQTANNGGVTLHTDSGQRYLQLTLDKTALEKGAWFLAQFSSDLNSWSPASPTPAANSTYDVIENSATRFIIRDKTPISTTTPRFGRVMVKKPE